MGTSHTNRHDIHIPNRKKRNQTSHSCPHQINNACNQNHQKYNQEQKQKTQNKNLYNTNEDNAHKQSQKYKSKSLYHIEHTDGQLINKNSCNPANSLGHIQGTGQQNNMQQTPSKQYQDIEMIHSNIDANDDNNQNPVKHRRVGYDGRSRSESKLPNTYLSNNTNYISSNNMQPRIISIQNNADRRYLSNNQNIRQYFNQYQLYKPVMEANINHGSQKNIIYIKSSNYKSDYNSPASTSYSRPSTRQAGQPRPQQGGKQPKNFYDISLTPQSVANYKQVTKNTKPISYNYYFPSSNNSYVYPSANNINFSYNYNNNINGQQYWPNRIGQNYLGPYANQHGSIY